MPRERIEAALSGERLGPVAKATGLGAASSSCSYAAIAIAKSLFQKGASAASALAFQFASTNLVWELGLVLWVLLGWQFTLAEYRRRHRDDRADVRCCCGSSSRRGSRSGRASTPARPRPATSTTRPVERLAWRERSPPPRRGRTWPTTSAATGRCCGRRSRSASCWPASSRLLGDDFFNALFVTDAPAAVRTIENVIVGPLIAVLSFVCSVGNVPLAAVLWSGGISLRRRDGVHLRRPDRAADRRSPTASTTARPSRCGSPR